MSTRSHDAPDPEAETITVTQSDGWYVARDETTAVSSQGETKADALANLADALYLYHEPVPEELEEDLEPSTAPWFG